MAEALLHCVVRGVANKAADALVQTVTGMCGVEADRRKLERQLLAVQCKLADAEAKSKTNQYVKRWMKDFRTVAYQADDVLDGFLYEALRRQIQIGDSKTRKVLSHFTSHSPLAFRYTMSRKLNNVLEKINELVEEMNKFGLESQAEAPRVLYPQTHSGLDMDTEPVGREDDKGVVMRLLLEQEDQQKVQVLPIFGMGGLGKTTLAKMVYNDCKIQQHFQLRMWHCASGNFEAIALVKSIIELATKETCDLPHTMELLRGRLQQVIGWKRFLLVVDDVLGEVQQIWEDSLKPLLCAVAGPGSVILVTTRSQRIATMMCTLQPHELACLSEEHSWELFSEKAFSKDVRPQAELITIGKDIVNKCKGLPLALKTMGGLMSSKRRVREWEAIAESNIGDNDRGKDEIISMLKLSYEHLSSEMKQCFAICAVFSKGFEMEKSMLIQLWMAHGFVQQEQEGMMDLEQRGEFIFSELVWRSFLQDVKIKPFNHSASRHGLIGCRMHDLMHDLAKDVADECATIEELLQHKAFIKDVSHIKVSSDELELSSGLLKDTDSLRTLLLPPSAHKDLHKFKPMLLRALSCGSLSIILNQHINTKHLRYLDLSHSEIARLPNSVCKLYNLQTLRLNHCRRLQYLPEGIRTMRNLKHLYLFECDKLERMPPNIGLLCNLRTLTTYVVDTGDGYGIKELKDLKHLGHRLELYNLIKIKSGADAKQANIYQKNNLSEVSLCWGRRKFNGPQDDIGNMEDVLEALAPHNELVVLEVYGYGGTKFSPWMVNSQMCQCLKKLIIFNCPRCNDVPISHLLVSLEYLSLGGMDSLTTLCKISDAEVEACSTSLQFFPKLKTMFLEDLPQLEMLAENSACEIYSLLIFPQLEELSIHDCRKISSVPNSPNLKNLRITECCSLPISSLAHLTALSELSYDGKGCCSAGIPLGSWPSLVKLSVSSLAYMMMVPPEEQKMHMPLKTLRSIWLSGPNCFETTSISSKLYLGPWGCFTFVQELCISECHELIHWPVDEFRNLICLRFLSISFCANLEGKGSSSEEILPLPQLEMLSIYNCGCLPAIPMVPESLEKLLIGECASLVSLPPNLGNLDKLRVLQIRGCNGLKDLPDDLSCLEQLTIERCTGVDKFLTKDTTWASLLQRLPVLKSLEIVGCEDLQRYLIEGGEYFNLVSSIPCKDIPAPEKKSNKKSLAYFKEVTAVLPTLMRSCLD
ncbi:hypothetical protein ACQ4PT_008607 [Festuca glaucescens]